MRDASVNAMKWINVHSNELNSIRFRSASILVCSVNKLYVHMSQQTGLRELANSITPEDKHNCTRRKTQMHKAVNVIAKGSKRDRPRQQT